METTTLYGAPLSLYTGRARSYLIKAGIRYREQQARSDYFKHSVLPKAGVRTIPIVELANGEVIRDGAAIIDHFETVNDAPFTPRSAKQNLFSRLLDVIGAEGLLRPAMHYRWNFPKENLAFVMAGFRELFPPGPKQAAMAEATADKMRVACKAFGVTEKTHAAIEGLYTDLVDALNAHFAEYPYLLGGRPCIGDFGLIAPMFAHLGRDPKPLALTQTRAPHLYRWVERMNRPEPDTGEFDERPAAYLEDDEIPETLISAMKVIAEDFLPETLGSAAVINNWIHSQEDLKSGTPVERGVGFATFDLRGESCSALAQPYRFYLLARAQSAYDSMNEADKGAALQLLDECQLAQILTCKLERNIGREKNLEVWL
ncbi:MAG: glutathione S-transferase family protein [Pseudomonadota bacterium]